MKILHIVASLDEKYGGPSILVPEISYKQNEFKNKVDILTTYFKKEEDTSENFYCKNGVNFKRFKVFSKYRISIKLFIWFLNNLQ